MTWTGKRNCNKKVCSLHCGNKAYIQYSDTWYCEDPSNFREFTILRDKATLGKANKWCKWLGEHREPEQLREELGLCT